MQISGKKHVLRHSAVRWHPHSSLGLGSSGRSDEISAAFAFAIVFHAGMVVPLS